MKDSKGPIVSRRMKVFRQGLQEWETLRTAEQKLGREIVQAIVSKTMKTKAVVELELNELESRRCFRLLIS